MPLASPPDHRRGPDRGIFRDVSREQQEQQQERQYDQRLADEREELRDDRQRRQFDRHGGYGFRFGFNENVYNISLTLPTATKIKSPSKDGVILLTSKSDDIFVQEQTDLRII